MKVHTTRLKYYKGEHDELTNEDAAEWSDKDGLFAVADGVATAAFSNIWSNILVEHFVKVPLLSIDPFEVEWWLKQAQATYTENAPKIEGLPHYAQGKAREGSHSTLVTARVCGFTEDGNAITEFLAVGDSCAFVARGRSSEPSMFPLAVCRDFDKNPIALPTRLYNRDFHQVRREFKVLRPGDVLVLATDAVSRWICEARRITDATRREAFDRLIACADAEAWKQLVLDARRDDEMVEDDSTALVIRLFDDNDDACADAVLLNCTSGLDELTQQQRHVGLMKALENRDGEAIAIAVGDPAVSHLDGELEDDGDLARARWVARCVAQVRMALRANLEEPTLAMPTWRTYAEWLTDQPSAVNLRNTLKSLVPDALDQSIDPVEAHRSAFEAAAKSSDDDTVLIAYELLDSEDGLSDRALARYQRAVARRDNFQTFRALASSGDAGALVAAYGVLDDPLALPRLSCSDYATYYAAQSKRELQQKVDETDPEDARAIAELLPPHQSLEDVGDFTDEQVARFHAARASVAQADAFVRLYVANDRLAMARAYDDVLEQPSLLDAEQRAAGRTARADLAELATLDGLGDDDLKVAEWAEVHPGSVELCDAHQQTRVTRALDHAPVLRHIRDWLADHNRALIREAPTIDACLEQFALTEVLRMCAEFQNRAALWQVRRALKEKDGPRIVLQHYDRRLDGVERLLSQQERDTIAAARAEQRWHRRVLRTFRLTGRRSDAD